MDQEEFRKVRSQHWDRVARKMDHWQGWGGYYHQRIKEVYKFLVLPGQKILEIGCGQGDLLASLNPEIGVGVDFSPAMIERAKNKYPHLKFLLFDAHDLEIEEKFDIIILSDTINDLWDVQKVLERITCLSTPRTRLIINMYSNLWQPLVLLGQKLNLAKPTLTQNWLTVEDLTNLFYLADFEIIKRWEEVLMPVRIPYLSTFFNRYLVKILPFNFFAFTSFIIARPRPSNGQRVSNPLCSVIIPARNEEGNIPKIFEKIQESKTDFPTEFIFVEDHATDNTFPAIKEMIEKHDNFNCKLFRVASGSGKCEAIRLGFEKAKGEILIILDADMSVSISDLPRFYEALLYQKAEFVNGVRLVYPKEKKSMRFINLLGNKFFSLAFSWLLGQPIKDTLCGTKCFWKTDYELMSKNRGYFGNFDPFGDFELLFGAQKLNLKIVDMPIRYQDRTYGKTNIRRWKHGWLLIKMVVFAARRLKFI